MAPMGVACHAIPRWLTTPLAASPASFQPSNPAMATGDARSPMSLNSIARHLPTPTLGLSLTAYVVGLAYRVTGRRVSRRLRKAHKGRLQWLAYDWGVMSTLRTALA